MKQLAKHMNSLFNHTLALSHTLRADLLLPFPYCPTFVLNACLGGNTIYLELLAMKGFDAIQPEYNCFISTTISVKSFCGY